MYTVQLSALHRSLHRIPAALAPSTKLTATEVWRVLCFLFGVKKHDLAGIVDEMVKAKVSIEQGIASYEQK